MGGETQALTSITLTHHTSHSSLWEEELATALLAHEKGLAEICMWWDLGFISLFPPPPPPVYRQYLTSLVSCHSDQGQEGLWSAPSQFPSCTFHSVQKVGGCYQGTQGFQKVVWQLWQCDICLSYWSLLLRLPWESLSYIHLVSLDS